MADRAAARAALATSGNAHLAGWLLLGWATADQELNDALRMIGTNQVAGRACKALPAAD